MLQALKAKETDLAWQVSLSNIPELQQMESQGITTLVVPQPNPEQYAMNRDESQVPLFADRDVRQALSLAVDRQTIIDKLLYGLADIAINPWDQSPWQNEKLQPVTYDPEQAKQILDEAGWAPGDDGIRVKDGERLSFTCGVTSGNQLRENVQFDGVLLTLVDTAGLRDSADVVEREGIRRARDELERADVALLVTDADHVTPRDERVHHGLVARKHRHEGLHARATADSNHHCLHA